ncbi:hypothetical protein GCM10010219_36060 [Streptomyces netropsis]|nr:hypothetical protein GCM10010219_36060 [Streptomyces netropsis]
MEALAADIAPFGALDHRVQAVFAQHRGSIRLGDVGAVHYFPAAPQLLHDQPPSDPWITGAPQCVQFTGFPSPARHHGTRPGLPEA